MVGIKIGSRIGEKGQVVIPKPIRDQFGLQPNAEVYFSVEEGKIVLTSKSGEEILSEFISAVKKRKLPNKINWDKEYYKQFD